MADRAERKPGLSDEELAAEQGADLPDREAMSTLSIGLPWEDIENLNFVLPINTAEAANINTNASVASADADQVVIVDQGLQDTDVEAPTDEHQPRARR